MTQVQGARSAIETGARAEATAILTSLQDRAGKVQLKPGELSQAEKRITELGTALTAAQQWQWAEITVKNEAYETARGKPPGWVKTQADNLRYGTGAINALERNSSITLPSGVTVQVAIGDRTSFQGVTPKAQGILEATANAGAAVGVVKIVVKAGKGAGHRSHLHGSEIDIVGYQADGSIWTSAQRAASLRGGAAAGADRFGLYPSGSAHIGYSDTAQGRPTAVWGAGGAVTAAEGGRNFTDPSDVAFMGEFDKGSLARGPGSTAPDAMIAYRGAMKSIESSGDYSVIGPGRGPGDRSIGAYQVLESNIGDWTQAALGRRLTTEEFRASQEAQDKVFDHQFGAMVKKYGNVQDAVSIWLTGKPLSEAGGREDIYGTTGQDHVNNFMAALGMGSNPASSGGGGGGGGGFSVTSPGVSSTDYVAMTAYDSIYADQQARIKSNMVDYLGAPDGPGRPISELTADPQSWQKREEDVLWGVDYLRPQEEDIKIFTDAEQAYYATVMASDDDAAQTLLLSQIAGMSDWGRQYALDQLGEENKVFAFAGSRFADGGDGQSVGLAIVQGDKALKALKGNPPHGW